MVTGEAAERRVYVNAKLLEGWNRVAAANDIDWTFDTPETLAAEDELARVKYGYEQGEASLEEVRAAFGAWEAAQKAKRRVVSLF